MLKNDSFVYFLSVTGFFLALVFAILNDFEPFEFLFSVFVIFTIFYMIGLASTGFFIKYLTTRNLFHLDKESLEATIDLQIEELDKKEEFIREAHYFIENLENEELDLYKKGKK